MRHGILFFSLLVALVGTAGGVFVLVHQGNSLASEEIAKEALVASVQEALGEDKGEAETQERKVFEARLQTETDPELRLLSPAKQPTPAPTSPKSSSPSPTPLPTKQKSPVPLPVAESLPSSNSTSTPPLPAEPIPPPPTDGPVAQSSPSAVSFPININTAGHEELQEITGVGPAIAQRIIDYRNQNGPFQTIEEIKNVSGIGDVTFEKMKDEITVGDVVAPSPTPPPQPPPHTPTPPPAPETGKININTASYQELQEITGVGEVIAQRIIDYRTQSGLFRSIEEIKDVKGIGDATFEKMKDEITV